MVIIRSLVEKRQLRQVHTALRLKQTDQPERNSYRKAQMDAKTMPQEKGKIPKSVRA